MSEPAPRYVSCHCQHCSGRIEFEANGLAEGERRTVPCPHCGLETTIFVPEQEGPPISPPPIVSERVRAWREDAVKGDPSAQCLLGYAYHIGEEVPQDDTESVKWFRMSAEQGDAQAQHELGSAYKAGHGVQQDDAEALKH